MEEKKIGTVMDFFAKIGVVAFHVEGDGLKVGDTIHIKGHTTDLVQTVDSMEIEHAHVQRAAPGQDVALKVADHVREHDLIFREG